MVTLDGLGYKFAGWEAAGGIREASGRYPEAPERSGSCLGGPQILGPCPGEGKIFIHGPYSNIETIAVSL